MLWKSCYRASVRVNSSFENDCIIFRKQEPIFPRATNQGIIFQTHYFFANIWGTSFRKQELHSRLATYRAISLKRQELLSPLQTTEVSLTASKNPMSSCDQPRYLIPKARAPNPVDQSRFLLTQARNTLSIARNSARTSIDTITYLDVLFWSNGVHHDLTYFYILTYWNTSNSNQIFLEPKHFSLTIRMFIFVKLIPINHKLSDAFFFVFPVRHYVYKQGRIDPHNIREN